MIGSVVMAFASATDSCHDTLVSLSVGDPVTDSVFDLIYPEYIRKLSERAWTPIDIAQRAARLFSERGANRVLDVGAGVGKFCIVAALTTDLNLMGIEQREDLVALAHSVLRTFSIPRVHIYHTSLEGVDLDAYDGVYFYNPFTDIGSVPSRIDDRTTPLNAEPAERDVARIERYLARARPGMIMVTFHGFGGAVPQGWIHLADETLGVPFLKLWIRQ